MIDCSRPLLVSLLLVATLGAGQAEARPSASLFGESAAWGATVTPACVGPARRVAFQAQRGGRPRAASLRRARKSTRYIAPPLPSRRDEALSPPLPVRAKAA